MAPMENAVTTPSNQFDPWRWPTLALWVLFFLVGLYPGLVFQWLRHVGRVDTWSALVNSEHVITLLCAGFLAFFIAQRAREAGMAAVPARARGLVAGLMGLAAFLPIRLDQILQYAQIPVAESRHLLYVVAATKCLVWLYLLNVLIQYYLVCGADVFYRLPTILPSAREEHRPAAAAAEDRASRVSSDAPSDAVLPVAHDQDPPNEP